MSVTRVLALVALGIIGMAVDLAFLAHTEDVKQFIPFAVSAGSVAALAWWFRARNGASARAVQLAMVVMVATGFTGVGLHYRANMEFQLESDPSVRGFALFMKVMQAKAPPALAPLNVTLLGLIGLAAISRQRG